MNREMKGVDKMQTNVDKMQTLIKKGVWEIIKLFYENRNIPLHLREISRRSGMNESNVFRHLNNLVSGKILSAKMDGNLKKFCVRKNYIPLFFPFYDEMKLARLPSLRRNAIKLYIKSLDKKPIFMIVFGSTSKGNSRSSSDLDILEVYYSKVDNSKIAKFVENQKGIRIHGFQMTEKKFRKELYEKNDKVVLSAVESGFPVFNQKYYYEVIYGR